MRLPRKVIQGMSVRDYAYLWISGACPLRQWCSGARGIDDGVIQYVAQLKARATEPEDTTGLDELLAYLRDNNGHPAESYVPDE